jgi:dTDP-D-glucose 4,6-dehydratase
VKLKRTYKLDAPKGVRGRNSDNTLIKKLMNWAPAIRLEEGMEKTYKWIYDEMTSGKTSVVNARPRAVAAQA